MQSTGDYSGNTPDVVTPVRAVVSQQYKYKRLALSIPKVYMFSVPTDARTLLLLLPLSLRDPPACSRHAPSLIVLDDLDKIAPLEGEEGAGPFNAQSARISERLGDLLAEGEFMG